LPQLFLGVDGGGTKCRMRLADENLGTLAELVVNSPVNLQLRDGEAAYETILDAIPKVFERAGMDVAEAKNTYACFGMAGARLQSARLAFGARDFPFASLEVLDDVDIARAGAHEGEDGAVLIIGTGSAGFGMVKGKKLQVGGWGFLIGDAMSGAILGRELLRKSVMAHEGMTQSTPLTKAVMARFDNDPGKMMAWSFDNPDAMADALHEGGGGLAGDHGFSRHARPTDYGRFVPLVFEHLELGDAVAKELLEFELEAIDTYISWFTARGTKALALVGGLGQRLHPLIKEKYGDIIVEPKAGPLHGALILARMAFNDA